MAQSVKDLPAVWEVCVGSLGGENPLEKKMATHSSLLAGEPHGQRSLAGYSPRGRKDKTGNWAHTSTYSCQPLRFCLVLFIFCLVFCILFKKTSPKVMKIFSHEFNCCHLHPKSSWNWIFACPMKQKYTNGPKFPNSIISTVFLSTCFIVKSSSHICVR